MGREGFEPSTLGLRVPPAPRCTEVGRDPGGGPGYGDAPDGSRCISACLVAPVLPHALDASR